VDATDAPGLEIMVDRPDLVLAIQIQHICTGLLEPFPAVEMPWALRGSATLVAAQAEQRHIVVFIREFPFDGCSCSLD
jgi:hypothetical protein